MKEAGVPLRDYLKGNFDLKMIKTALNVYPELQLKSISYSKEFIELGIKDRHLKNLPHLYQKFLSYKDFLKKDGMEEEDIISLQSLTPKFESVCDQLAKFEIPATLEHGDFQDNNILIKNLYPTIIDFGDVVISHPFFSIVNFLESAERHHSLTKLNQEMLLECYLESWQKFADKNKLLMAYRLAETLWPFRFSLNFSRIQFCKSIENFPIYKGYMAQSLRLLECNLSL